MKKEEKGEGRGEGDKGLFLSGSTQLGKVAPD